MKFVTAKNLAALKLAGVTITVDVTDDILRTVTLADSEGNVIRLAHRDYSMKLEIPAPPKMVKKHRLHGDVIGVVVDELFDDEYLAKDRLNEFERKAPGSFAGLTITQVEVVDEAA